MTHSAKRARRKRLAQEAQQRKETPHPGHQMNPLNLSGTETDREEEEDDHEMKSCFRPESGNLRK